MANRTRKITIDGLTFTVNQIEPYGEFDWQTEINGVSVTIRPARGKGVQVGYNLKVNGRPKRRQHQKRLRTIEDALRKAKGEIMDTAEGIDVVFNASSSVRVLGELYLKAIAREGAKPATLQNNRLAFDRFCFTKVEKGDTRPARALLAHVTLADLTTEQIEEVVDRFIEEGLEGSTIKVYHGCLKAALEWACKRRKLNRNVANWVDLPPINAHEVFCPDPECMADILFLQGRLNGGDNLLHVVINEFMAHTGLRIKETLGLHVSYINREELTISVPRPTTKNKNGVRTLSIDPALLARLDLFMDRWERSGGMVFAQANGLVPDGGTVRHRLAQIGKALGLPQRLRPHMLRHYNVTVLLKRGMDRSVLQKRVGHAKGSAITDTYEHREEPEATAIAFAAADNLRELLAAREAAGTV